MFDKKDPLIASVKAVMEHNAKERAATAAVNEVFGITSRKALPHERQGEWDAAFKKVMTEGTDPYAEQQAGSVEVNPPKPKLKPTKSPTSTGAPKTDPYAEQQAGSVETVKEALKGDQPEIDVNKNNRVDGHDLKLLRMKKIMSFRKKNK